MFGGIPSSFYAEYHKHLPKSVPEEEYDLRSDLYLLFHYLNHTLIFGVCPHFSDRVPSRLTEACDRGTTPKAQRKRWTSCFKNVRKSNRLYFSTFDNKNALLFLEIPVSYGRDRWMRELKGGGPYPMEHGRAPPSAKR